MYRLRVHLQICLLILRQKTSGRKPACSALMFALAAESNAQPAELTDLKCINNLMAAEAFQPRAFKPPWVPDSRR